MAQITINGNDIAALQAAGATVTTTANGSLVADFGGKQAPELDLSGCSNLTIQNAVFSNTTYGINADSCSNLTIANDAFSQTGAGVLANNCQNTTVTSCHFSDMTAGFQQGGGLVGDWAQFSNCTGVNLTNNVATNGPGSNPEDGFNFYDTRGVPGFDQISGNTAGGSNAVGSESGAILQLENNTSGFTVANNIFGNSPHDVICLTGANNIVIENNQLGIAGDGNPSIQLQGGAGTPVEVGNIDSNLPIADAATVTPTPTPVDTTPIATPTPVDTTPIATPTPAGTTPVDTTPVDATPIATPTPADTTPVDATTIATPAPADATPVDAATIATPAPAGATPVDATPIATPTPTDTTPVDATTIATPAPVDTTPVDATPIATQTPADTAPVDATPIVTPTPADATPTPVNGTADQLSNIFTVINDITTALNSGAVQNADAQAALPTAHLGHQGDPGHWAVNATGDASNLPSHIDASAQAPQLDQHDAHPSGAHHDYTWG
jgi:hypothetical protein